MTRANITGAHITRDNRRWTAFGVRASMADDGLGVGINHEAGVCIHFADKVPSRLRKSGRSALPVTVKDPRGSPAPSAATRHRRLTLGRGSDREILRH